MASKCASENRSIGKGNKDEHGHMSDSFYNHEGRLAKKSNRIGNMENDDHDRALERTMRAVNSASIAVTLRSQGSLGHGEGSAPGLDGVFAKQEPEAPIHIDTDENDPEIHHLHSEGLSSALAAELLKKFGRNELPEKKKPKWLIFAEQLYQPMPLMIWAAIIIEAAIESWPDMGILLAIQFMNASLSYYETTKAGDAVAALKASLKPVAYVKRDGKFLSMDAALLVPGDLVLLGSGGAVPADCVVMDSQIDVDQAALTGESLPVTMFKGDSVKMGSTVVRGEVEATVEATGANTFFGRTASLLSGGDEVSNLQKLLIRIMIILVVLSMALCGIAFGYLLGRGETVRDALSFTVVLLVASIPIAIEIVCTTTLALGSRELSKDGAIVSRLAAIEDMAGMSILCSDKTGTLTLNKMMIQEETPIYVEGETQYSLLRYAAMASKWTEPPRDALDTLVHGAADMASLASIKQLDYMPFDPTIKRTEGTVQLPSGETFKVSKGAPHIIMHLVDQEVHAATVAQCDKDVEALGERGIRSLAVAKTKGSADGPWELIGLLTFLDPPRPDTKDTIERANKFGVEVKMITGDHLLIAKETARQLSMGTTIENAALLPKLEEDGKPPKNLMDYFKYIEATSGFAQVFPEHKFLIVEALRRGGYKTGMTGDGVNDAPALKRADVGVAVQGSTDAARAAADIVLTKPGLSTIVTAIIVARTVFGRMTSFITYRIAATLQLLIFFFIAVLTMQPAKYEPAGALEEWPAFFHMPVMMLMLITLLNDGTLISIGYDNVVPNTTPDKWNLKVLFTIAGVLGGVALLSSLLMLWVALNSHNPAGIWAQAGLAGLTYGQITSMVYLKVSISDFLTLFSSRSGAGFFWTNKPSAILLVAAGIACSLSTIMANAWPESRPDGVPTVGLARVAPKELSVYVWIYCLLCWFIQDAAKVGVYAFLKKYNIFGINDIVAMKKADPVEMA
ncbi:hypothetical protein NSK_003435 [Nannochloropsis salina CCMP1776]|uniref:Plasma membrane ATPase n=1 Tax=Nannochloropsis salina CCMP1776 TaxID=1027361 RepID=A0A4D9D027_9STRA|nr:hypothetical protein NSK_003435 [Nannochloropsis salina CCMP1776]|eukprot:TFJ85011.1 hypothetical protein NSK_003435 [Nannochloropsis salina CCMP1776]